MTSWISSADMKAYLCDDTVDDPTAQALADAATSAVRDYLKRDLEQRTYNEVYSTNNTDYIMLENWPVISIASVQISGIGPIPAFNMANFGNPNNTGWVIDDANVTRKLRFAGYGRLPRPWNGVPNILVSYLAGYPIGTPPDPISSNWFAGTGLPTSIYTALKLTGSAIWNAQAADPNLAAESTIGVFSGQFYPTGVGAVPPGARFLLDPYIGYTP
jgi:hypothetical protein